MPPSNIEISLHSHRSPLESVAKFTLLQYVMYSLTRDGGHYNVQPDNSSGKSGIKDTVNKPVNRITR